MSVNNCNCGYSIEDIDLLQDQIDEKLASRINAFYSSQKFDLGKTINIDLIFKISRYKNLLERIKHCDKCFDNYKLEDIFSVIKNKLNEL
ncbi:MAG: hypothetical protein E6R13_04820 [Spirochaetes bacterium]|nr:MAG: hypothetical protein E6R13_04820 [Spirochaetota bacterium]